MHWSKTFIDIAVYYTLKSPTLIRYKRGDLPFYRTDWGNYGGNSLNRFYLNAYNSYTYNWYSVALITTNLFKGL